MDSEPLMLSGIQHFAFCPRQWALIHIEQQWQENVRTVDGNIFHQRAHHGETRELRGDLLIIRGLRVYSEKYGITGICDVVEFHRSDEGIPLSNNEGLWVPYPVEYKKGNSKDSNEDRLQLCAQAICLEEMLSVIINEGALFYGEPRKRERVFFTEDLREQVSETVHLMHQYFNRGFTPKPHRTKACNACSMVEICLPQTDRTVSVKDYIRLNTEVSE